MLIAIPESHFTGDRNFIFIYVDTSKWKNTCNRGRIGARRATSSPAR